MIGNLKPYAAYKDSGVPWLGDIPERWEIQRTKRILRERSQKGFPEEPLLAATQTKGVVRKEMYETRTVLALKDLHLLKLVCVGDFVISLRSFQGGIEYAREQGIISPAYTILYPINPQNHNFLTWLFKSKPYVDNLSLFVTGIRQGQNIDYTKLSRSELAIPPLEEQTAIATFLDYADRHIRRYIRSKQKLIKLLEEQKQGIINEAVTRGLDPNVPMKRSGIEWLGDIPKHWEIWQIGHFAKVGNGSTPSRGNSSYWKDGTFPWLNSSTVNQEEITTANQFITDLALKECHLPVVPPNSILMAITGQGKTRGTAALLCIEATINQHIAFITPKKPIVRANYFKAFLSAAYPELRRLSEASGSTKGALTCWDVSHFKVTIPPMKEQEKIEQDLKEDTQHLDTAIERLKREITLFHEFRTRLIADVVTGKLDVREAAAKLPVEVDELDALEEDLDEDGIGLEDELDPDAAPEDDAA